MISRIARHTVRALRLDRSLYAELQFSSQTAGDAVVAIAGLIAIGWLRFVVDGRFSLSPVLSGTLNSLILWLVTGGILWLAATKLFDGEGGIQDTISLAGFAFLPWVLMGSFGFSLLTWLFRTDIGPVMVGLAFAWTGAGMVLVSEVGLGVERPKSAYAATLALVGLWIVRTLLF